MNPVAKNCYKFNKPKVERNRKAYSRTTKHKNSWGIIMFNFTSEKNKTIMEYEEIIAKQNEQIAELSSNPYNSLYESDVEVDFEFMNAFSVERTLLEGVTVTAVGYFDRQNNTREWFLYTSEETHQRLVNEFREYKFNKYNEE